ncbi:MULTISPECIES: hypothetical protein [unclassified Streptomyces]|uniref:hypothetical protein n=1 Tax=Streptomyces sp. NPDC055082 TaxID=3365718 RepID=UPI0037D1DE9D
MSNHDPLVAPLGRDVDDRARGSEPGTGRALASAVGLLTLASCGPMASGVLHVRGLLGVEWTPSAYHQALVVQLIGASLTSVWLLWAVVARTRLRPAHRWMQSAAAAMYGAIVVVAALPSMATGLVGLTLAAGALAWLAIEVTHACAVPLNLSLRNRAAGTQRTWTVVGGTIAACAVGGGVMGISVMLLRALDTDGTVPVMVGGQLPGLGLGGAGDLVLSVLCAVILEDLVLVAAGSRLLAAAGRPAWQIYTTICVIEVLLHAYVGVPALAMALYGAGRVWLFRRYGLVTPMIIGHAAFDLVGGLLMSLPLRYRLLIALPCIPSIHIAARIKQRSAARHDSASQSRDTEV